MVIERLLRNPHYYSGALLAQALTCLGTIVWGIIVVSGPAALNGTAYAVMTTVVPEDVYGWIFAGLSVTLMLRLFMWRAPTWFDHLAYFSLLLLWVFVLLAQLVVWFAELINPQGHAIYPTATAGASVMGILSVCAFASNPKNAASAA